ncbi:eCIS core domain-containing protein [Aequorivita ciconiae]|uniref:eCIS core domain-containing protein n=1 Tax=Aequorivita ciconiae TaxID=2494375 RepID=UPI0013E31222|nr:DUF4157 domain-containing protein [Aequorivita sp. H23M31]
MVQPKLEVNSPGDIYEKEADAMADRVMRMPAIDTTHQPQPITGLIGRSVQRKCSKCEEEERKKPIMRKAENGSADIAVSSSFASSLNASKGGGSPLPSETRNFMENAFSTDFSGVRIHADQQAGVMNNDIKARAFTYGNDIYFGNGQLSPHTTQGKRLIAHELTHTLQQTTRIARKFIQRTPSADELIEFNQQVAVIRSHSAYAALPTATRRLINQIIAIARTRDNWQYYLTNLSLLLSTPDAPPVPVVPSDSSSTSNPRSTREMNETEVNDSLSSERSRLFYPEGSLAVNSEENQTTSPPRVWKLHRGTGGKYYRVDARDAGNIFVKIKVKLSGRNAQDIANVQEMEDGIEKKSTTFGYIVNLEFVNTGGNDVFNVGVDLSKWTTSGNWASGVNALAHEMHHLMGLDDRYNYIDAHAANADMDMTDRVYWFRQQMNRSGAINDADSIMNDHDAGNMQADDIAGVAHISEASVVTGQQVRNDLITNIRRKAAIRVSIAYLRINGTNPHFDRFRQLQYVRGLIAPDIVNLEQIAEILSRMLSIIMGGTINVGPEIDSCTSWAAYVIGNRVPIHLCSRFFALSEEQQIRTLIHESAHAVGIGQRIGESYFPYYDCTPSTDDNWSVADAWARYINCNSGQTPDRGEQVTGSLHSAH